MKRGITVIEVLVCIAILVIGATIVLGALFAPTLTAPVRTPNAQDMQQIATEIRELRLELRRLLEKPEKP